MHAVKNSIFDDLELHLIASIKVETLWENLKTPIRHFDDGWRHYMKWFSKFVSEVMNSKLCIILPIRYLEK